MDTYYALILGASSGFGRAISLALAKDGVNILGVHLDRAATMPAVEEIISEIKSYGVEAHYFNVNAADPNKRSDVLNKVKEIFKNKNNPTIKVLVHSLAFGTLKKFIDDETQLQINQKQLEMTIDVMANSLVYWSQDVLQRGFMKSGAKIYALTSTGGSRVIEFYGAISAAKACLESHIRQLAMELGKKGISANAILAGVTDTPALKKIPNKDFIMDYALNRNAQGRLTQPEDIANFILDNYKRDSHWMTGGLIHVDGGESVTGF
ncbi:MAG: SDR family oxidoreductase [Ignavibacteria bacterium]|jgi:NAD(P)-dependent dehydrogenase (short-subunit alcohol dehydrogenase family)